MITQNTCDAGSSCYLVSGRSYGVSASMAGYANANYTVVAP